MAAKTTAPAPAPAAATPAPRTFPQAVRGATVLSSSRGRSGTPSVFLADAIWSLEQSKSTDAEVAAKAWVAFQNVTTTAKQELINEWSKAARALKCGLSKHVVEHADKTVDVLFRCQAKRDLTPEQIAERAATRAANKAAKDAAAAAATPAAS